MADTKISALTAAGSALLTDEFPVNEAGTSKKVTIQQVRTLLGHQVNYSTAAQGAGFATDTYVIGSAIAIPSSLVVVGSFYHCIFDVSKTAAGTATPLVYLPFGTAGTTGDAVICTFTFTAGTAAADLGTIEVWALFRTVGSGTSAVVQGRCQINHNLSITGLVNLVNPTLQVTSSGFNSTTANSIIGVSVNGGTSASWTVQQVWTETVGI